LKLAAAAKTVAAWHASPPTGSYATVLTLLRASPSNECREKEQMRDQIYANVARALDLPFKAENEALCRLSDLKKELPMSIELTESDDMWIWTCKAIVGELTDDGPDLLKLLMLNSTGLEWCYHALEPFEEEGLKGTSLDLKYTFATPANDEHFAQKLLITVLYNMRKYALEVTRNL
jgi:hypothetical protein